MELFSFLPLSLASRERKEKSLSGDFPCGELFSSPFPLPLLPPLRRGEGEREEKSFKGATGSGSPFPGGTFLRGEIFLPLPLKIGEGKKAPPFLRKLFPFIFLSLVSRKRKGKSLSGDLSGGLPSVELFLFPSLESRKEK